MVSLDTTETDDILDLKLLEALQRIERLRSRAMQAAGMMLAER
ncbi:MAG TPA: hypothetical protein VM600_07810 [Actinomycetota bacterium]|nr:hypothetical protein [Actinomycetota bacterium]